jgi:hypothetical protein
MTPPPVTVNERTPLILLVTDAIAFWVRNQTVFWLMALPIAGLAAAGAYLVDTVQQFTFLRRPEAWHFLFALIYAMFVDRWIKESLLDGAADCEGVDELRRALVPPPFLMFAIIFFLFAMALSWLELVGIDDSLARARVPPVVAIPLATLLAWLPHLLVWATALAFVALRVPAWSAGAPLSQREAWRASEPVRPRILRLIVGATFLSMAVFALTTLGVDTLPRKPWVPAAMAGAQRLADCLLLAIVSHVMATLFRVLTDWQQPEPEDRPFRHMRLRPPAASR